MKTIKVIRSERLYNLLDDEVGTILNCLNAIKESYIENEISAKQAKKQYYRLMERANILNKRYINIENITGIEKTYTICIYRSFVDFFEN